MSVFIIFVHSVYVTRPHQCYFGKSELISKLSFFSLNFLFKRSSDKIAVVKDSCICYLSADEQELRGVMLFDSQFFVEPGNYSEKVLKLFETRICISLPNSLFSWPIFTTFFGVFSDVFRCFSAFSTFLLKLIMRYIFW